jgi:hypothetical protein
MSGDEGRGIRTDANDVFALSFDAGGVMLTALRVLKMRSSTVERGEESAVGGGECVKNCAPTGIKCQSHGI